MSYVKQQWVDGQTKVDAAHLNHIEQGIADVESAIPDVSQFATKDDTYTKEQIDSKISSVMSYKGTVATVEDLPSSATVGDVYNVTDTGMNYAWNGSQWDALGSDIDLSNYVTNTQFETELAKKQPAGDYATVEQLNTQLAEKQPVGDYATTQELNVGLATKQEVGDYPVYQKFSAGADPAERKTIQLANHDTISGLGSDGTGYNIAMVSKWDKVDLGTPSLTMNLNSLNGEIQINDEKIVATVDQIPDVSNFVNQDTLASELATKQDAGDYALKSEIPDVSDFATHTEVTDGLATKQDKGDYATNEVVQAEFESYDKTIKAYVDSKLTAVYTYKGSVANEQALPTQDQTVGDVYNVEDTGKNVAWDGEKWDELGGTVDLSAYAKTEDVNAQLATKADKVHTHEIADVNGLQAILDLMPVEIKLPVRTGIGGFQDKLYTQEEIFAWFGVTDLSGFLALAKSTRQVWISYVVGASFQTSAYRYLANYIEYVPASQSITVIWVGPDSANADVISKFMFKANLDQTVIAGASNVQLTVTSIE